MMPIERRLLESRNDARMAGHRPVRARISPRDMKELETWIKHRNTSSGNGLPQAQLSTDNLHGMKIVEDEKVTNIIVLEMEKKQVPR